MVKSKLKNGSHTQYTFENEEPTTEGTPQQTLTIFENIQSKLQFTS